ncbi:alanine/glycine:cation symporter family protein [Zafaria sp. Z1313]|uniref:alanine/glycine:cation symporter family protein n=1 Tax=unclassified Zafaria TaxID=2828765 RepID=UPI002E79948A|nr:alanine/glycine:cation symporter family protein [Zafaria sp. J156]MEE1621277.1 alanine/glycine:cation symporter family protein [Zafaria sp. J156]
MELFENEALETWLADSGDALWTYVMIPVILAVGLSFTVRTGVVQFRMIPNMLKTLTDKALVDEDGNKKSISAFQAFTVSAASRVGVGNVAGVATAIAVGGPGAVFWMWTMAFIGGASSFIESTLGQLYKVRTKDGYRGGPAYYMERGLKARWMGILFAIILIVCFPFAFSSLQANTIAQSVSGAMGQEANASIAIVVGLALAVLTALVVFGGIRRIATVTESLVPSMAVLYILLGLVIVGVNVQELPRVVGLIFTEAFNFQSAIGGGLGTVILQGIKRGMFSNEAGLGSAPNAGATASVTHPVKQGLVQTLGVYFDTFIVCSVTAFIILVSVPDPVGESRGIALTQTAVTSSLGNWASILLAVIIFLLAFSSIIGNYYYGESNVGFMTDNPTVMGVYRSLATAAVFIGSIATVNAIWNFADGIMGLMALVNLIAISLLAKPALKLLKHYMAQYRDGKDPVFVASDLPELHGVECWEREDVTTHAVPIVKPRRG